MSFVSSFNRFSLTIPRWLLTSAIRRSKPGKLHHYPGCNPFFSVVDQLVSLASSLQLPGMVSVATITRTQVAEMAPFSVGVNIEDALKNAAATTVIEPDAIWHSDRGSVYTSAGFRALVTSLGMRCSMGRTAGITRWRNRSSQR